MSAAAFDAARARAATDGDVLCVGQASTRTLGGMSVSGTVVRSWRRGVVREAGLAPRRSGPLGRRGPVAPATLVCPQARDDEASPILSSATFPVTEPAIF